MHHAVPCMVPSVSGPWCGVRGVFYVRAKGRVLVAVSAVHGTASTFIQ